MVGQLHFPQLLHAPFRYQFHHFQQTRLANRRCRSTKVENGKIGRDAENGGITPGTVIRARRSAGRSVSGRRLSWLLSMDDGVGRWSLANSPGDAGILFSLYRSPNYLLELNELTIIIRCFVYFYCEEPLREWVEQCKHAGTEYHYRHVIFLTDGCCSSLCMDVFESNLNLVIL